MIRRHLTPIPSLKIETKLRNRQAKESVKKKIKIGARTTNRSARLINQWENQRPNRSALLSKSDSGSKKRKNKNKKRKEQPPVTRGWAPRSRSSLHTWALAQRRPKKEGKNQERTYGLDAHASVDLTGVASRPVPAEKSFEQGMDSKDTNDNGSSYCKTSLPQVKSFRKAEDAPPPPPPRERLGHICDKGKKKGKERETRFTQP